MTYTPQINIQKQITEENIQSWLVNELSQQLRVTVDEIDITARLDSYGLDSAHAMFLISKAEKQIGIKISPMLLWHYPTIELLSQRLIEDFEEDDSEVLEI